MCIFKLKLTLKKINMIKVNLKYFYNKRVRFTVKNTKKNYFLVI